MRDYQASAIDALARAIERSFIDQHATEHHNVCDALLEASENIASGLHDIAEAIRDHTERG